ncbi:MAG: molybdopterin-dependent oxidoreductase [Luteitalea sp.]|nr:molybdopterin-dependent oxidoreductase [Luteitalea sp.]
MAIQLDLDDMTVSSRRQFMISSTLAAGGLLLHGVLVEPAAAAGAQVAQAQRETTLSAWLKISTDNMITIVSSQAEMGQGIQTTLPAALADELGADWSRVRLENAPVAPAYRNPRINWQFTGNSESTTAFFDLMREMGAAGREMLIAAAAARWSVDPGTCRAEQSHVIHSSTGRRLSFGELAEAAATLKRPEKPRLKSPSEWTLIGTALPRIESTAKVNGSAIYGMDVTVPGMVYAAVKTSPVFGGTVTKYDRESIRQFPGVMDVVAIPNGVAVVARSYWQARTALDALHVEFDDRANASLSSETVRGQYQAALAGDSWHTPHVTGDRDALTRGFATTISHDYESQFLAHATMEPMNCTASVTADACDVWAPTQGQELTQIVVSQLLGIPKEKIAIHRTLLGGGFGRRLVADFVVHAVVASKAVAAPVKVIWSREEDMQHDIYRPAVAHRITAGIDARGRVQAIAHKLVSPSILQFVYPPAVTDTYDPSCCEGVIETRYRIPNVRVDFKLLKIGVPTSVLRTTGFGPNVFALESFIDELAHAKGQDPYQYRRELLGDDARARGVLDMAAEKSGWTSGAQPGRYRGIAFCEAFRTLTAHVVEISVAQQGVIKIHRVTCVADPGTVLDPGISANSLEGGVAWGLSCAFLSQTTFARGRTMESNWHDYRVFRMPEMPPVDVHFVDSGARPLGGIGEVGPVTVIPALTNAIFQATGQRYRSLPLSRHGLSIG